MAGGMRQWADNPRPRKPSVIGIGAQKAGTTWLYETLGQHPRIWTPPFKEVHYFDYRFKPENRNWIPWHMGRILERQKLAHDRRGKEMPPQLVDYLTRITVDPGFDGAWYRSIFAPSPRGKRPMDITPEYSAIPEDGVAHMAKFLPQAQFIYILRHPVDRLISQLKMNLTRQRRAPETVEDWLAEIDAPELYDRGDYAQYVPRWQAQFDEGRLLVLPFGDIARDPLEFLRRIEAFLDLPAHSYRGIDAKVFSSGDKLSVPDPVRAEIRRRLEPQFEFLTTRFGEEFVHRSR